MCYIIVLYAISMASADIPHAAWVGGPYAEQMCSSSASLAKVALPRITALQVVSHDYGDAKSVKALLDDLGCTPLEANHPKNTLGGVYQCTPPITDR